MKKNIEIIKEYIEKNLSAKRLKHSAAVAETAAELSDRFGCDAEKAYFAGLAHDCAKELDEGEMHSRLSEYSREDIEKRYSYPLRHGPIAACMLKYDFNVTDEEILDAVWYHTTGKENMPLLTKIIYLADFIEPNRDFDGIDRVRKLSEESLDKAIIEASGIVIASTLKRGLPTDLDTVLARNYLIEHFNEREIDFSV